MTPRERDVLRSHALGRTWRQCARDLGISFDTIRTHQKNAYAKLGATCREDAYRELGWLRVP